MHASMQGECGVCILESSNLCHVLYTTEDRPQSTLPAASTSQHAMVDGFVSLITLFNVILTSLDTDPKCSDTL